MGTVTAHMNAAPNNIFVPSVNKPSGLYHTNKLKSIDFVMYKITF